MPDCRFFLKITMLIFGQIPLRFEPFALFHFGVFSYRITASSRFLHFCFLSFCVMWESLEVVIVLWRGKIALFCRRGGKCVVKIFLKDCAAECICSCGYRDERSTHDLYCCRGILCKKCCKENKYFTNNCSDITDQSSYELK